jgi:hypothetical protein
MNEWDVGTQAAIGLAAFLLGWYLVGLYLNRRRAGHLVRQIRDSIQPLGGTATIRFIGRNAFRIEVDKLAPPFATLGVSLLLEPRETFVLWLIGRCAGRRDWLMVSAGLTGPVRAICEVYHPRRRGAMDSRSEVQELGWKPEPLPGRPELVCAAPGSDGRGLAQEAMALLHGTEVWRLRIRNKTPHLSVSLPLPVSEQRVPLPVFTLLPQIAALAAAAGQGQGAGWKG